jgi:serine/threonine protein kinase
MNKIIEWNGYHITRKYIGKGSFAKVYYGINIKTKQEVAIKKISFNQLPDNIKDKTLLEIKILENFSHPNIIKLYEYKFELNHLFLIMEYCNCGNLSTWINKSKTSEEIFNVIKQIMEGINYLHINKIIHRDIKPENILLHNSIIKICDFGFSLTFNNYFSVFQTICGTPMYMSPEIINMQKYTIKSEIWSLGILFYNIFFNQHPYGILSNISEYKTKLKIPINLKTINIFNDTYCNYIFNELITKMLSLIPNLRPSSDIILNEILNCEPNNNSNIYFSTDYKTNTDKEYDILDSYSFINSPCISSNKKYDLNNLNELNDFSLGKPIIIDNYFNDNNPVTTICDYINSFTKKSQKFYL